MRKVFLAIKTAAEAYSIWQLGSALGLAAVASGFMIAIIDDLRNNLNLFWQVVFIAGVFVLALVGVRILFYYLPYPFRQRSTAIVEPIDLRQEVNRLMGNLGGLQKEVRQTSTDLTARIGDAHDQIRRLQDEIAPHGGQIQELRNLLTPRQLVADANDVLSKLHVEYLKTEAFFGRVEPRLEFYFKATNYSGIYLRLTGQKRGGLVFQSIERFVLNRWEITSTDTTGRLPSGKESQIVITWAVSDKALDTLAFKAETHDIQDAIMLDFGEMFMEIEAVSDGRSQSLGFKRLPQGQIQWQVKDEKALETAREVYKRTHSVPNGQ